MVFNVIGVVVVVIAGMVGVTVMVNVTGGQPDEVVAIIVAVIGVSLSFRAINAGILPVPLAGKPIPGWLFTQL